MTWIVTLDIGFETVICEVVAQDGLSAIAHAIQREAMDRRAKGVLVIGHVVGSAALA